MRKHGWRIRTFVKRDAGFTLVELLVVLGIIALLMTLVAPQVVRYLSDARTETASVQLKNIESALELYFLDTGQYPPNEMGAKSLVEPPPNSVGWRGHISKKLRALSIRGAGSLSIVFRAKTAIMIFIPLAVTVCQEAKTRTGIW